MERLLTGLILAILVISVVGIASAGTISPSTIEVTLNPGESVDETKTVTTDPTPVEKLDVLFVIDLSGSMWDELDEVKDSIQDIMDDIKAEVPDSAFGVASFVDYPGYYSCCDYSAWYGYSGDYAWNLDIDITTDTSAVSSVVSGLALYSGGDGPQDYSRALYESQFVGWRDGAKKVVIIFGDAPPHDCDFCGFSTGCDPGRDEIAGTADDLDFETVVSQVADSGIAVIAVDSSGGWGCAEEAFRYMASETGGQYFALSDASDIPEAVVEMVEEEVSTVTLTLGVSPADYAGWVTWDPAEYTDVGGNETRTFDVTITVPGDATPGTHNFVIQALADGSVIAEQEVTIHVPEVSVPEFPAIAIGVLGLLGAIVLLKKRE